MCVVIGQRGHLALIRSSVQGSQPLLRVHDDDLARWNVMAMVQRGRNGKSLHVAGGWTCQLLTLSHARQHACAADFLACKV